MILNTMPLPSRVAMKAKRPIVEAVIDGKPVVLVTASDGSQVVIDTDSFTNLWTEGYSVNWSVMACATGHAYVTTKRRGSTTTVPVGRAIMKPSSDYAVRYLGGTFDLRKDSLEVVPKEALAVHARQTDPGTAGVVRTVGRGGGDRRAVRPSPQEPCEATVDCGTRVARRCRGPAVQGLTSSGR